MMRKKLVVISIDALGTENIEKNIDLMPTIAGLIKTGTWVKEIEEIYPSLTYPSHTSIITGVYPNKHGIVNNTKIQPKRLSPDWFWYKRDVKAPSVIDLAHQNNYKTAAFLWPVTAKSGIDYNIAEIFPNRIWTNQVLISLQASSPLFLMQMNHKYGHLRKGIKQPYLDDFITACAVDTIKSKEPDLTLIHLVDLDSMFHHYGVYSKEAKEALKRQDDRVKQIISAIEQTSSPDNTSLIILGDHYQLDVTHLIRLNARFKKLNWCSLDTQKMIDDNWKVYAKSCDGSCYIYSRETNPDFLKKIKDVCEAIEGIETIYSQSELKNQGADDQAVFMLEAKRGYYFVDEHAGSVVEKNPTHEIGQPERYNAVHGYHPSKKNYATTFIVNGPQVKINHQISKARLIDEAPTILKLLGLPNFDHEIDGKLIDDLFIDEEK